MDGAAAEQHSQAVPSLMNGGGSQEGPEAAHRVQAVKGAQEDGKPGLILTLIRDLVSSRGRDIVQHLLAKSCDGVGDRGPLDNLLDEYLSGGF